MDEYVGLYQDAPQRFGNFLNDRLFQNVKCITCMEMPLILRKSVNAMLAF